MKNVASPPSVPSTPPPNSDLSPSIRATQTAIQKAPSIKENPSLKKEYHSDEEWSDSDDENQYFSLIITKDHLQGYHPLTLY